MSISVAKMALIVLAMAGAVVYALNMMTVSPLVGMAIGLTVMFVAIPSPKDASRVPPAVAVVSAFVIAALGLVISWATYAHRDVHGGRVLNDLGWAQTLVGVWLAYSTTSSIGTKLAHIPFDDAARARWREGDMRFGVELARRIVVRAQPSWAALVVETAWPEPRPEIIGELLQTATTAKRGEISAMSEALREKGGVGEVSSARWELARVACEVIGDAHAHEDPNDVGGPAVARFVVAAAGAVRDDEDAKRIFAALVLPAVARRA